MKNDKVEVVIEETISQTFLVDKDNLERIEEMYKDEELVLDNAEVHSVAYTYDDINWVSIK